MLAIGDPKETISVPMIHSSETINWRKYLSKDRSVVNHTVIVRKMPREYYLKHYAKDEEGNYVGTEKPALDAALVFVPSKSTPEDLLQQVHKVAFGKHHYAMDFSAGAGMVPAMMNTGGGS
jgi:SRSO17 transposase